MALKILLSTSHFDDSSHGGNIIAKRHYDALCAFGNIVYVAVPNRQKGSAKRSNIYYYDYKPQRFFKFVEQAPNRKAVNNLRQIIRQVAPDIVYEVHGPIWTHEAAYFEKLPSVTMVGDYKHLCLKIFLVNSDLKRCSGPESRKKCYKCVTTNMNDRNNHTCKRYLEKSIFKQYFRITIYNFLRLAFLWVKIGISLKYLQTQRNHITKYIIGDRQASEFLQKYGILESRMLFLPQALPKVDLFTHLKHRTAPLTNRPLIITFVGRMHADKGFKVLAKAFELIDFNHNFVLWVVHSEHARDEIVQREFSSEEIFFHMKTAGKIKLFRPKSTKELYKLMARTDIGIIPSLQYESPSLVLLEFVAQKTPIIRSESKGMDHIIQDNINGRTFKYGDSEDLARTLKAVAAFPEIINTWRTNLPNIDTLDKYVTQLNLLFRSVIACYGKISKDFHSNTII